MEKPTSKVHRRLATAAITALIASFIAVMAWGAHVIHEAQKEAERRNPTLQELLDAGSHVGDIDGQKVQVIQGDQVYTCYRATGKCPKSHQWP